MTVSTRVARTLIAVLVMFGVFIAVGGAIGTVELAIIALLMLAALAVIWRPRRS